MVQTIEPTKKMVIHFDCYDNVPENKYVAWIEGDEYRGMVVSANSVADCMNELSISLKVLEMYRINNLIK